MAARARQLEADLPRGEVWFRKRWNELEMRSAFDEGNAVWQHFILDLLNQKYRYVIEIDGPYHSLPDQQRKDARRDYILKKAGYLVLRIHDYNEKELLAAAEAVRARRLEFPLPPEERSRIEARIRGHRERLAILEAELLASRPKNSPSDK
jgi:very-short-patch-repair endonuclease